MDPIEAYEKLPLINISKAKLIDVIHHKLTAEIGMSVSKRRIDKYLDEYIAVFHAHLERGRNINIGNCGFLTLRQFKRGSPVMIYIRFGRTNYKEQHHADRLTNEVSHRQMIISDLEKRIGSIAIASAIHYQVLALLDIMLETRNKRIEIRIKGFGRFYVGRAKRPRSDYEELRPLFHPSKTFLKSVVDGYLNSGLKSAKEAEIRKRC